MSSVLSCDDCHLALFVFSISHLGVSSTGCSVLVSEIFGGLDQEPLVGYGGVAGRTTVPLGGMVLACVLCACSEQTSVHVFPKNSQLA